MSGPVAIECEWVVTTRCTFQCEYCFARPRQEGPRPADDVARAFSRLAPTCLVFMTGGEPFLYPGFVELCLRLTEEHVIGVNTNLTTPNVAQFVRQVDPSRVVNVHAALHVQEREKRGGLAPFVDRVLEFQAAGFPIEVSCVAYPPVCDRIPRLVRSLADAGVAHVAVKVFRGCYRGRRYPEAYTAEHRELLRRGATRAEAYLAGAGRLQGRLCRAGQRFIRLDPRGNATRCASIDEPRGNLFEGDVALDAAPTPCAATRCKCLFHADRYLVAAGPPGPA